MTNSQQTALAVIRFITGLLMVYHGWEVFDAAKINEYAGWDVFKNGNGKLMAYAGKAAELIGGLMLAAGLFTRVGAVIIAGTMLYITFFIGNGKFWMEDQHPFLFVLLASIYFFTGGGPYSLDKILFKKKSK